MGINAKSARAVRGLVALFACALLWPASALAHEHPGHEHSFLGSFHELSTVGSTVPENGDVNPYGIVNVNRSVGSLVRGDILISNFNDENNEQGTGTTLVQVTPSGSLSVFAQINAKTLPGACPGGVGLTTALAILPSGYVVVGSLPTSDGSSATAEAGCLIVLSPTGEVVKTISGGPINGPWDMTEVSVGPFVELFVTNVLNGTVAHEGEVVNEGTVVRIALFALPHREPQVLSEQVIADGFPEQTNEEALVLGPTGDAVGAFGTLYVADTQNSRITAIPGAVFRQTPAEGGGITVSEGGDLNAPLGMTLAPNGDLLTANGGDGNLVETTPFGKQVAEFNTGAPGGGLFGLTVAPKGRGVYFVNDAENTLQLLH